MLRNIILFSIKNKFLVLLFVAGLVGFGIYSLSNIPIGAVPDVTNNQVQVISTTRDLSTEDVERFLTYPVELEMSNLPGVKEIRSISKFGLSVVTVVFDDNMRTYLPRQLISEKLSTMASQMPVGLDVPSMGPISTGLGEIYQYILDVKPGYEEKYSVEELRTIQDWIVKRQLAGISGVVEVNTWGGFIKTYEVAVDPQKLKAVNITLDEVYTALQDNNSVAGGGYIEKSQEAYFIRADGLAKNLSDLEDIVVTVKNGTPIYIRDLGNVGYGAATRFGAITGNGEGEKVLGQVMMLKGADSKKVISAVTQRVDEIQKSLPEGVFINPFLTRTDLIGRTTFTVAENLILGFLIVLFVVVLLLGNWRSGLLVASVIPLTLLFALSMMYLFGVDANLMSLGAIDFGIIIDGAVIIVEYLTYLFVKNASSLNGLTKPQASEKKDSIVLEGANKMMHSAVFGQMIIIIVFIPILTLSGVEGKMFRPMGMTFCFALAGAMILCFTYVPVMASLLLKPSGNNGLGHRLISSIMKVYRPLLERAIKFRWIVISAVVILFIMTLGIFSRMGGEFVPTLDEGDFVIQPVLKTGMSLAATVEMTTRIEKILKRFPEVKQVVSRIGAAEVPTDPMSMEESDVIITLTERSKWASAVTKDELADVFKTAINEEIPNVEIEFTQPIEMRFNELISGARSDLAIKVFGEDLDVLYSKAEEIERLIKKVDGAADISIEKIDGLPQMAVKYDRQRMSRYGVSLSQLNDVIKTGFAGKTVGTLNEGERQFEIVLKYGKEHRSEIEDLRMASVSLPTGEDMPLSTFANIEYDQGPAKISRDDTKRRVVVGVNIRGRDLQSVVTDIRKIIDEQMKLPIGYNVQYGGQFENLENATKRLMIAVPVALLLIFVLLYFAFRSVRETLLIYTAIPLSAIGGVLALYFRDMPFSISAGVGFIALFGIAVLNGIVLIEHFKELKKENMTDSHDYIIQGAVDRIRPVLLTAIAAALGFLPMAISSSAGAEIQRPLATVVIGGLVSATLLTLIILPILYIIFGNRKKKDIPMMMMLIIPFILGSTYSSQAQQELTLDEAIVTAKANSYSTQFASLDIVRAKAEIRAVQEISNYDFFYAYDRNNITENGQTLHVLGASHSFKMPSINQSKKDAQLANVNVSEQISNMTSYEIEYNISKLYEQLQYTYVKLEFVIQTDSIYKNFYSSAKRQNALGETNGLELLSAKQKMQAIAIRKRAAQNDYEIQLSEFRRILKNEEAQLVPFEYRRWEGIKSYADSHPMIAYQEALISASEKQVKVVANEKLPEINVSLFNGIGSFNEIEFYPGLEAGISIPLARGQYKAKEKVARIDIELLTLKQDEITYQLNHNKANLQTRIARLEKTLDEYQSTTLSTSDDLIAAADKAMSLGEISYMDYLILTASALESRIGYIDVLHEYNQAIISLNYNHY